MYNVLSLSLCRNSSPYSFFNNKRINPKKFIQKKVVASFFFPWKEKMKRVQNMLASIEQTKGKENNLQYSVNPQTFSIAGPNERLVALTHTHTAYLFCSKFVSLSLSLIGLRFFEFRERKRVDNEKERRPKDINMRKMYQKEK